MIRKKNEMEEKRNKIKENKGNNKEREGIHFERGQRLRGGLPVGRRRQDLSMNTNDSKIACAINKKRDKNGGGKRGHKGREEEER